jgi:alpha-L-arabinofuranosidase
MANIAQIVNVIAPIFTKPDGIVLQTTFYPFEIYSKTCGTTALDVHWSGDTFSAKGMNGTRPLTGLRTLDVSATLDEKNKKLAVYAVNRSQRKSQDVDISLVDGRFKGRVQSYTVNGNNVKDTNTFKSPNKVVTKEKTLKAKGTSFTTALEPHSFTAFVFDLA